MVLDISKIKYHKLSPDVFNKNNLLIRKNFLIIGQLMQEIGRRA